jgi:hypothetical protein
MPTTLDVHVTATLSDPEPPTQPDPDNGTKGDRDTVVVPKEKG